MINDNFLRLSENQGPVDSAGSASYPSGNGGVAYSANYIDLQNNRDIGDGSDMECQLYCTQALSTDQTWGVLVMVGATPYAVSGTTVASFGYIGGASSAYNAAKKLAVSDRLVCSISPLTFSLGERYLYVHFINHAITTSIAGKFTIDICQTTETTSGSLHYPGGFSVR